MTHQVELVLPAAYYYVKMAAGCIELQGTVVDLVSVGQLRLTPNDVVPGPVEKWPGGKTVNVVGPTTNTQSKLRKLVEDEVRV